MTAPADSGWHMLTAAGPAGVATLRLFGPLAARFLGTHVRVGGEPPKAELQTPRRLFRAQLVDEHGQALDDVLIALHSVAPDWDVRVHLHGSPRVCFRAGQLAQQCGLGAAARRAPPVWPARDRIDAALHGALPSALTLRGARWFSAQAERLRDALNALSSAAPPAEVRRHARAWLDGLAVAERFTAPLRVALIGPPNSGKSTLLNALAEHTVSLVSPRPGATRDWVEAAGELDGFPVAWIDTAGMRADGDVLERAGIEQARLVLGGADAVVLVLDATRDAASERSVFLTNYRGPAPVCVAWNKCDRPDADAESVSVAVGAARPPVIRMSGLARVGLDELRRCVALARLPSDERLGRTGCFSEELSEPARRAIDGSVRDPRSVLREWLTPPTQNCR